MSLVDWQGLALDLEAQAMRVESQTAERAMLAAAHGLRLMGPEHSGKNDPRWGTYDPVDASYMRHAPNECCECHDCHIARRIADAQKPRAPHS